MDVLNESLDGDVANTSGVAMDVMIKTEAAEYQSSNRGSIGGGTAPDNPETTADFNAFHEQIQASDPMLLWSMVRSRVAPHVSLWDFVCDKARGADADPDEDADDNDPKDADYQIRKLQTYKLKVMLEQLGEVVMEMGKMVNSCCIDADVLDSAPIKTTPSRRKRKGSTAPSVDDQELILSVNKTMSRVLHNKIPNESGNGFKLKREIPDQYSNIFHVDVPEMEEDEEDVQAHVKEDDFWSDEPNSANYSKSQSCSKSQQTHQEISY